MPIAFQSVTNGGQVTGVTSLTFPHTVSAGSERILIVQVRGRATTLSSTLASSVTFNGLNLIEIAGASIRDDVTGTGVQAWYLLNPPVTTANVVVTWATVTDRAGAEALTFTGVDQTNPIINTAEGILAATITPSFSINSTSPNSWVLSNVYNEAVGYTLNAGPTQRVYQLYGTDSGGSATTATTAITTVTHSLTNDAAESNEAAWAMIVLRDSGPVGAHTIPSALINTENIVSPITWSHPVASGDNYLVVCLRSRDNPASDAQATAVTFNGVALTLLHRTTAIPSGATDSFNVEWWGLASPPVGTFTVSITTGGTLFRGLASATSLRGISTPSPVVTTASNNGAMTTTASTISVNSTESNTVVLLGVYNSAASATLSGVSSADLTTSAGDYTGVGFDTPASPTTVSATWTNGAAETGGFATSAIVLRTGVATKPILVGYSPVSATDTTTLSYSVTVSGTNRLLIVNDIGSDGDVTASVTFNGVALTEIADAVYSGTQFRMRRWALVNPPAVTANVVITRSNGFRILSCAEVWENVNQSTPFGSSVNATALTLNATPLSSQVLSSLAATRDGTGSFTATGTVPHIIGAQNTSNVTLRQIVAGYQTGTGALTTSYSIGGTPSDQRITALPINAFVSASVAAFRYYFFGTQA